MRRSFGALAPFAGIFLLSAPAFGFCRTTICDPNVSCSTDPDLCCIQDADGCDSNTPPISWPTSCVSYVVHSGGSKKQDIEALDLSLVLDQSFQRWLEADCSDGPVALAVEDRGFAMCGQPEFNQGENDPNANVWMFRDQGTTTGMSLDGSSQLAASALAVTTVSFNEDTAEIYDVDVELLSSIADFSLSDDDVVVDLASVVTHEAGHFLGLDHSKAGGATMSSGYYPGDRDARTLTEDDALGICASYPTGRSFPGGRTCEPRGEFSRRCAGDGCSCRTTAGAPAGSGHSLLLVAAAMVAFLRRRRRFS
jgi:MYXO-CTERM domain-containing protein